MKKILCTLLSACLVMTMLFGCGQKNTGSELSTGHEAELVLPAKTDLEKLADLNGAAAVQAYLVARTYLDDFLEYDAEHGNLEEYSA